MQIDTFRVFCDLVETSSFSEAADRNGVTQSAVSQQIRALEERFGVVLIERGKRNFAVTPEGETFLAAAREITYIYRGIESKLDTVRNVVAGPLRVATVHTIGFHELPPYLAAFRQRYPEVDLTIQYRQADQVYSDILEMKADLGMVAYPQARKDIEVEPVWKDRLVLICRPGHPLAKRKKLPLQAIDGERFVSFDANLPTRKAIDELLRKNDVRVKKICEFDNIETLKRGVEIENAVSIVPRESVSEEVAGGTLHVVELKGRNLWRPLGAIRRRSKALTPAMRELIHLLKTRPPDMAGDTGGNADVAALGR